MRALIVFGADVNIANKRHETPRHVATLVRNHCWQDVVRALGFVGATACDKSKNGCTLECSKPFLEEMVIGKYNKLVFYFIYKLKYFTIFVSCQSVNRGLSLCLKI